jgi:Skp family chaperone for outer membrane proteins
MDIKKSKTAIYLLLCIITLVVFVVSFKYFTFERHQRIDPPQLIAVLDGSRIKDEALPFIKIRDSSEIEFERLQKEIQEKESFLREEQKRLTKQESVKQENSEKRDKQRQIFEQKVYDLQKYVQGKQLELNKKSEKSKRKAEKELDKVIEKITKKNNIDIVFNVIVHDKRVIFFYKKQFDITNEVISKMNKLQIE